MSKIVVIGKEGCKYCEAVVRLIKSMDKEYIYLDATDDEDLKQYVTNEWLKKDVDKPTLPLIIVDSNLVDGKITGGVVIGGYTDYCDYSLGNFDFFN